MFLEDFLCYKASKKTFTGFIFNWRITIQFCVNCSYQGVGMLSERSGSCRCFLPNSSTSVCEVGAWLLSWVFFLCLGGKERKGKKKAKVEEGASRKAFVGLHNRVWQKRRWRRWAGRALQLALGLRLWGDGGWRDETSGFSQKWCGDELVKLNIPVRAAHYQLWERGIRWSEGVCLKMFMRLLLCNITEFSFSGLVYSGTSAEKADIFVRLPGSSFCLQNSKVGDTCPFQTRWPLSEEAADTTQDERRWANYHRKRAWRCWYRVGRMDGKRTEYTVGRN